jgi:hypothetical protein
MHLEAADAEQDGIHVDSSIRRQQTIVTIGSPDEAPVKAESLVVTANAKQTAVSA